MVDIHKKHGKRPDFDIYIGRRVRNTEFTEDSKWANRFYNDLKGYEQHVRFYLWEDLNELDGKKLGCWCITTDKIEPTVCHGQVLMKLLKEKKKKNNIERLKHLS